MASLPCGDCGEHSATEEERAAHRRAAHAAVFAQPPGRCGVCSIALPDAFSFIDHFSEAHAAAWRVMLTRARGRLKYEVDDCALPFVRGVFINDDDDEASSKLDFDDEDTLIGLVDEVLNRMGVEDEDFDFDDDDDVFGASQEAPPAAAGDDAADEEEGCPSLLEVPPEAPAENAADEEMPALGAEQPPVPQAVPPASAPAAVVAAGDGLPEEVMRWIDELCEKYPPADAPLAPQATDAVSAAAAPVAPPHADGDHQQAQQTLLKRGSGALLSESSSSSSTVVAANSSLQQHQNKEAPPKKRRRSRKQPVDGAASVLKQPPCPAPPPVPLAAAYPLTQWTTPPIHGQQLSLQGRPPLQQQQQQVMDPGPFPGLGGAAMRPQPQPLPYFPQLQQPLPMMLQQMMNMQMMQQQQQFYISNLMAAQQLQLQRLQNHEKLRQMQQAQHHHQLQHGSEKEPPSCAFPSAPFPPPPPQMPPPPPPPPPAYLDATMNAMTPVASLSQAAPATRPQMASPPAIPPAAPTEKQSMDSSQSPTGECPVPPSLLSPPALTTNPSETNNQMLTGGGSKTPIPPNVPTAPQSAAAAATSQVATPSRLFRPFEHTPMEVTVVSPPEPAIHPKKEDFHSPAMSPAACGGGGDSLCSLPSILSPLAQALKREDTAKIKRAYSPVDGYDCSEEDRSAIKVASSCPAADEAPAVALDAAAAVKSLVEMDADNKLYELQKKFEMAKKKLREAKREQMAAAVLKKNPKRNASPSKESRDSVMRQLFGDCSSSSGDEEEQGANAAEEKRKPEARSSSKKPAQLQPLRPIDAPCERDRAFWEEYARVPECPRGCGAVPAIKSARLHHYQKFHYAVFYSLEERGMAPLEQFFARSLGCKMDGDRVCSHCSSNDPSGLQQAQPRKTVPTFRRRIQLLQHIRDEHQEAHAAMLREYNRKIPLGHTPLYRALEQLLIAPIRDA